VRIPNSVGLVLVIALCIIIAIAVWH